MRCLRGDGVGNPARRRIRRVGSFGRRRLPLRRAKIYFHSAKAGHKLDAIRRNDKASFCVVDRHDVVAEEFTTYFTSAIAFGRIRLVEDNDDPDKMRGLELLADKYSSTANPERRAAELARLSAVVVPVMTIEHLTGKAARELIRDGKIS